MKNIILFGTALMIILMINACNLEKEVDLNLPTFESELVVECYLEAGKPYRLNLSETSSYFDSISLDNFVLPDATVVIRRNGVADTLVEGIYFDEDKLYVYGSSTVVPPNDFQADYELEVTTQDGRQLTARTRLLPPIPIDSVLREYLEDSTVSLLTIVRDPLEPRNFYYRTIHRTYPISDSLKVAFTFDDDFINGPDNTIVVGAPPVFEHGDTAILTLYNITEAYSSYIETTQAAADNNGNPFATPGRILTNVQGGTGIFTGLSYTRMTYYLD